MWTAWLGPPRRYQVTRWVILRLLRVEISYAEVLAFEVVISLLRSVAFVVPSGLGVQDAGYVAFFGALGIPDAATLGVAFVLVKRAKEAFWIAVGFLLFVILDRRLGDTPDAPMHALGFRREIDALDPPVAPLSAQLHPAVCLEAIDHPARARAFHFHHVGELGLRRARVAMQPRQHQPLGAGDAELAHAAIERGAQQARGIRDHDADIIVGVRHGIIVAARGLVS